MFNTDQFKRSPETDLLLNFSNISAISCLYYKWTKRQISTCKSANIQGDLGMTFRLSSG